MTLLEIIRKINERLSTPAGEVAVTEIELVTGAVNPVAGIAVGTAHVFLQQYDNYKLKRLIKGLSKDRNVELCLNKLYNYVGSSESRAFTVGNVLKETIAAKSPKIYNLL